jgi:hypothetical protein
MTLKERGVIIMVLGTIAIIIIGIIVLAVIITIAVFLVEVLAWIFKR